ncbi:SAVED domain-containing protein [Nocardia wallacei]|uniref:SAVED domain-containing protein n=1 Tax=Nocardia wallacei TaxID=480035 RepID=UPI002453EDAD|nr:SAVED domain-containing protein [Nocardia wallacei]
MVVDKSSGPDEYIQVKAAVSAKEPASTDWLCEPTRSGGPGILRRFYKSWQNLSASGNHKQLTLVTNRSIDPNDPVLTLRDRNDRLADQLRRATAEDTVTKRAYLAEHLGCSEDELLDFLTHLQLRTDASEAVWRQHIAEISYGAGIQADANAFRLGVGEVREWVKTNRIERRADDIEEVIERLGLRVQDPFTVVSINALEEQEASPGARITLDWVDRFRGTEAKNRRGLKDPQEWDNLLRPQLIDAKHTLRALGARRILITGTMRLPTWFTAAVTFQETSGFTLARITNGEHWTKPSGVVAPAPIIQSCSVADLPPGRDVALALAISVDPTADARRHFANTGKDIPILTVQPAGGYSSGSITGLRHAYSLALAVRDLAREISREIQPPVLHLFIAAPPGFVVLLGSMWDRVPTTQTYEDLNPGYEPAFLIPN